MEGGGYKSYGGGRAKLSLVWQQAAECRDVKQRQIGVIWSRLRQLGSLMATHYKDMQVYRYGGPELHDRYLRVCSPGFGGIGRRVF